MAARFNKVNITRAKSLRNTNVAFNISRTGIKGAQTLIRALRMPDA